MTPQVYRVIQMNELRHIVRGAQNKLKDMEWSDDYVIAKAARIAWDDLEKAFRRLGGFQ